MRVRGIGPVLLLLLSTAGLWAQDQIAKPQFRAGVELIQLDVAVLDDQRQPVRGLSAADFTVFDNGVAKPIRAFTPVELAARTRSTESAWSADVPPDVATNQVGQQDGRLVIILMDRSIPAHEATLSAKKIAAAAVDALGPGDLAAVVSTSNGAVQNLTADRERLLRAINSGDPSTGITPAAEQIMGKQDPLSDGRCLCGLCVLETITRVADAVQDTPRRRKILFFIGTNVIWQSTRSASQAGLDTGCEVPLKDARNAMFAAVDRANLTVHSIDPQGLVNIGPQTQTSGRGGFDMAGPASGPARRLAQQQADITSSQTNQQNLQVLPARTGGRTVVGRNNPEQAVQAIFQESVAYYVLGIERGTSGRQEDTRSIEVKVTRRGARVYAQRHYVLSPAQPNATAEPRLLVGPVTHQDALGRLLPSATRPLALAVTAFASPDSARAIVRLDVDAGAFAREGATAAPLDFAIMAVDQTGRSVASARQTSMITAPRPAPGRTTEVNVQSRLELSAGDYQVRVAVSDPATGAVASVFSDLIVPEFDRAPLSVSGLTVDAASPPTAAPVPTTRRVFRRTEQVRALLQIYQGTLRTEAIAPVSMRVQILDAKGAAVRDQALPFAERTFSNRRADCVITLPVANLPPGEYLLKLEASIDRRTAGRALRFAVE